MAATKKARLRAGRRDLPYYKDAAAKRICLTSCSRRSSTSSPTTRTSKPKWVRVDHWGDAAEAQRVTLEAIERYNNEK